MVDFGTEFIVDVLEGGREEFVVLLGAVDVSCQGSNGSSRVRLTKGQAAFLENGSEVIARYGEDHAEQIVNDDRRAHRFYSSLFFHQGPILNNGDFQSPNISSNSFSQAKATDWTRTGPLAGNEDTLGDGQADSSGQAAGEQFVLFNENGTAVGDSLHQAFATVSGQRYKVSFRVLHLFGGKGDAAIHAQVFDGNMPGDMNTAINSVTEINTTFASTKPLTSFRFTAHSEMSTIVFTDVSSGALEGFDTGLDKVSVTLVESAEDDFSESPAGQDGENSVRESLTEKSKSADIGEFETTSEPSKQEQER